MVVYVDAARQTLRDHGGTFDRFGYLVHHEHGYCVGGIVPSTIVRKAAGDTWSVSGLAQQLATFARQHNDVLSTPGTYLGTWVHDDAVHIDATQWVADRAAALDLAFVRGELAIWDCYHGNELATEVDYND